MVICGSAPVGGFGRQGCDDDGQEEGKTYCNGYLAPKYVSILPLYIITVLRRFCVANRLGIKGDGDSNTSLCLKSVIGRWTPR